MDEIRFALEVPPFPCPSADIIPAEFAASSRFEYLDEGSSKEHGDHQVDLTCAFQVESGVTSMDGEQAVNGLTVQFHITDGSSPAIADSYFSSPVDTENIRSAAFLDDWDRASATAEINDRYGSLQESDYFQLELFAQLDNLYIGCTIGLVVVDEDFDAEAAAFETLQPIIDSMVSQLERE